MAFYDPVVALIDPLLSPLLAISPLFAIIVSSFIVGLFITLIHKFVVDQHKMKAAREQSKKLNTKFKNAMKENPDKAMKIQQQLMDVQKDIMFESFKPALITMIPVLILFAWINTHLTFEPILPGEDVTFTAQFKQAEGVAELQSQTLMVANQTTAIVDNKASWVISGPAGRHNVTVMYGDTSASREILISDNAYLKPKQQVSIDPFRSLNLEQDSKEVLNLGFFTLNGLWSYIVFSILFSIILRKVLGVH